MANKKAKQIEAEIEMQLNEETDLINLTGVIKSEMDDARDFIYQVGEERAESTEYYLAMSQNRQAHYSLSLSLLTLETPYSLCCLPSCVLSLVLKRWLSLYRKGLKTLRLPNSKRITSTTLSNKRTTDLKYCTMRLKMHSLERQGLSKCFGMTRLMQLRTSIPT